MGRRGQSPSCDRLDEAEAAGSCGDTARSPYLESARSSNTKNCSRLEAELLHRLLDGHRLRRGTCRDHEGSLGSRRVRVARRASLGASRRLGAPRSPRRQALVSRLAGLDPVLGLAHLAGERSHGQRPPRRRDPRRSPRCGRCGAWPPALNAAVRRCFSRESTTRASMGFGVRRSSFARRRQQVRPCRSARSVRPRALMMSCMAA